MTAPLLHDTGFREATIWATPIRDLGLTIEGTQREPIVAEFRRELEAVGFRRLSPRYYLSTEWGVPFETVAIAIPFYLAHPELQEMHAERTGHVEGRDPEEILRYLRHEMGHVVNYAYRLYDTAEWEALFGSMSEPYEDDYRPVPFSRKHVRHLPGWYAQKHPDEDFAETFAVWLTPRSNWRRKYHEIRTKRWMERQRRRNSPKQEQAIPGLHPGRGLHGTPPGFGRSITPFPASRRRNRGLAPLGQKRRSIQVVTRQDPLQQWVIHAARL